MLAIHHAVVAVVDVVAIAAIAAVAVQCPPLLASCLCAMARVRREEYKKVSVVCDEQLVSVVCDEQLVD